MSRPRRKPSHTASESSQQLGHHIRQLRASLGLTLRDVERRGGISATHVSEIERGEVSPTVRALGRIAEGLGVPPSALLRWPASPAPVVGRSEERAPRAVRWGEGTLEPLTWGVSGNSVGAYFLVLPVGREPALCHSHQGEEWLTVLSGTAQVTVEGRAHMMREGDSLHFRASGDHEYTCRGPEPAVLLVACNPRLTL